MIFFIATIVFLVGFNPTVHTPLAYIQKYNFNVVWPRAMMSTNTLYKRCNTIRLSERAELSRWKMLGHILRSDERSPAQAALCYAVEMNISLVGRIGCHRKNLFQTLKCDLKKRSIMLNNYEDVLHLRELASDRGHWNNLFVRDI